MTVTGAFAPAAAAQESPPTPPHNYYGTVTDQDGVAVSDAAVEVTYDGEVLVSGETDSDGNYDVKAPQENGVEDGDAVTISVEGASEERTWEPAGTTRVDFEVEASDDETPGDGDGTTTAAPGNGGGGSGGGGGGGGGAAPSGPSTVSGNADVASDGRAVVDLSGGKAVENVEIRLPVGTTGSVSVEELADLPAGVSETRGARMALLDIHAPDFDGTAVVRMSVSKRVVDAYRASPEELTIEHYDEDAGEWETLDTSVASTSDDRIVLETETSGFSLYAVTRGDSEAVTTTASTPAGSTDDPTTTPGDATDDPTTDEPTTTTRPFPGFGPVVALVALLAVALLAYRRE